ncbi:MAG: dienelactone hydrolase family protein [Guyparkeria sp.]
MQRRAITTRLSATALPATLFAAGLAVQTPALADNHGGTWEPSGEDIGYQVDGEAFEGYLSSAEGESRGTVLVIHDWDGIDDYERKRADMIAAMGFDAFAVDLYGEGNRPQETGAKKTETQRLYQDRERMQTLTRAGLEFAREQGVAEETVVMGYCFGGAVVLEAARNGLIDQVAGYATFHGGLGTPEGQSWSDPSVPVLIAHGGADSMVSMEDVATLTGELEDVGATYTIEVYSGAPHAFTIFDTGAYQERADRQSWTAFTGLLDEAF